MKNINELILFLKGKCDNHFLSVYEYTECRTFLEGLENSLLSQPDEISDEEINDMYEDRCSHVDEYYHRAGFGIGVRATIDRFNKLRQNPPKKGGLNEK